MDHKLTDKDRESLRKNPNILLVEDNTIIFSHELKKRLVIQYKLGRSTREILKELGLDLNVLGPKRMEKNRQRWIKAWEAGTLNDNNNDEKIVKRFIRLKEKESSKTISIQQRKQIEHDHWFETLKEVLDYKNEKIESLQAQLDSIIDESELKAKIDKLSKENDLLKAKVEALETVFITKKDFYDYYNAKQKNKFHILIECLIDKYQLEKGARPLLDLLRIPQRAYFKAKLVSKEENETILSRVFRISKKELEEK